MFTNVNSQTSPLSGAEGAVWTLEGFFSRVYSHMILEVSSNIGGVLTKGTVMELHGGVALAHIGGGRVSGAL